MKQLLCLAALFAFSTFAADVSGTWKGTVETPNGNIERTFVFKVDGAKLTGETTSQMMGKSEIKDGKVDGDTISFTISVKFEDNEMKLKYTGKMGNSEIKFHVESDAGMAFDYSVKKIS